MTLAPQHLRLTTSAFVPVVSLAAPIRLKHLHFSGLLARQGTRAERDARRVKPPPKG
jgi:hypothetical protein